MRITLNALTRNGERNRYWAVKTLRWEYGAVSYLREYASIIRRYPSWPGPLFIHDADQPAVRRKQ